MLLIACGSEGAPAGSEPDPLVEETPSGEDEADFSDYGYKTVDRGTCDKPARLGRREMITLESPDTIGTTIFDPNCVLDVKVTEVEITLDNTSTNLHNIIVAGNDHELVAGAGEKASTTFQLAPDADQIGFQCTIHDRMYGAFFR